MEREPLHTPTSQGTGQKTDEQFRSDEEREGHEGKPMVPETPDVGGYQREGGIQERAESVLQEAKGTLEETKGKISRAGERIMTGTDNAMSAVGQRIEDVGETIRSKAPSGRVGRVVGRTGEALQHSGQYLRESGPTDIRRDIEQVMRERPLATLFVGAGLGFLLARAFRRR